MAKRSHRRLARAKKDRVGCIWGLISMLDFRHGNFTRKLLKDKKHGTGRHVGKTFLILYQTINDDNGYFVDLLFELFVLSISYLFICTTINE